MCQTQKKIRTTSFLDTNMHPVMGELKNELKKRLDNLMELNLNEQNLMKVINCHLISVLGYVMHVSEWTGQTGHDSEKCITERRILLTTINGWEIIFKEKQRWQRIKLLFYLLSLYNNAHMYTHIHTYSIL